MTVMDVDGVSHRRYLLYATSLKRAEREALYWVGRAEWDATLVGVRPAERDRPSETGQARPAKESNLVRPLALAGLAFVV